MTGLRLWGFRLWAGLWAGAVLLVFAQGYFMSRQSWMLPVGLLLTGAWVALGWLWERGIARGGWIARNALRLIGVLHLVPLVLQLLQVGAPRWDNLLLAAIAWGLLEVAGWPARPHEPATSP